MKHGGKVVICLVGGLLSQAQCHANVNEDSGSANPYSAIVDRNVFNLKPPPPVTPIDEKPIVPPTKIDLLGIVAGIGVGPTQVMFRSPSGTPPKETSYTLATGERDGDFEIVSIDVKAGSVRLKNHGQEQTLTLEENGLKPGGNAPPPLPGVVPGARIPHPGAPPLPALPAPAHAAIPTPAAGSSVTTFGAGSTLPTRNLRVTSSGTPSVGGIFMGTSAQQTKAQETQPMSQEEQIVRMEINRKLTEKQVADGLMPPLPPTPLTGK